MDTQEIIRQLELGTDEHFPRQAMEAAIAQKDQITPGLLDILERIGMDSKRPARTIFHMAHVYAMFLLAQFREKRAYPVIVELFSMPDDIVDALMGGLEAGGLENILASVCGDDTSLIEELIENEDAGEFARGAAVTSLAILAAQGLLQRERVVAYYRRLFNDGLARTPSEVWNSLARNCAAIHPGELMEDIELAYAEGLVEEQVVPLCRIRAAAARDKNTAMRRLMATPWRSLVDDAVKDAEIWLDIEENLFRDGYVEDAAVYDDYGFDDDLNVDLAENGDFDDDEEAEPEVGRDAP